MSKLEEIFLELREANTKYSIRILELEKENTRLDEENSKLAYSLSQSVPVESSLEQYDRIKELERELQKVQNDIESLRAVYKKNIDSLSAGSSEDLLKTLRTYPTALPYICELKQELQATREQFNKSIGLLRDLIFDETDRSMIDAEKFLEQLKQKDEVKCD